jgi:hypothetical protein
MYHSSVLDTYITLLKIIGNERYMNIQININKSGGNAYMPESEIGLADYGNTKKAEEIVETLPSATDTGENSKNYSTGGNISAQPKPIMSSCSRPPGSVDCNETQGSEKTEQFSFEKGMVDMFTSFMSFFKEMMQQYMSQIKEMVSSIVASFRELVSAVPKQPAVAEKPVGTPPVNQGAPRQMESFRERMPKILSSHASIGHINEVDLQAGIIAYQLYQKSEDAEQFFLKKLAEQDTGKMSQGEALKAALIATQESGKISKLEAEFLYTLSHRTSQLDENLHEVSESPHGAGTMDLGNAMKMAEIGLAKVIHGHIILEPKPLY